MRLSRNFILSEFRSKDGADFPDEVIDNLKILAEQLQALRDELKLPILITSGYRSSAHNKAVGGARNSTHMKGIAADIQVIGVPPPLVARTIRKLQREGKMRLGGVKAYATFTHYDFRGKNITW